MREKINRVSPRPTKILFVFEFPPSDSEWQVRDLTAGLRARRRGLVIEFCSGVISKYRPGGLSPMRVLNGLWVHVRTVAQILFGRHDVVIVRSAPPLIQMTVSAACRVRGTPYWVWLMDAHPEIEALRWGRIPGLGWLCRRLASLNARCLARAKIVVVLDEGMRRRLIPDMRVDRVIICPTWGSRRPVAIEGKFARRSERGRPRVLRLAYLGNLSMAHDLPLMDQLLQACAERVEVEVTFIGTSEASIRAMADLTIGHRITLSTSPRIPFDELSIELPKRQIDYGIISLAEEFLGLLSPSKFSGYLVASLPIIYLGPAGTNAAIVCDELGAGIRLSRETLSGSGRARAINHIVNEIEHEKMREQTGHALRYLEKYDGDYLAGEILACAGLPDCG